MSRTRVCVVGSGTMFVSGISHYTYFLATHLNRKFDVSAILMRRLIPRALYPGRKRVGSQLMSRSVEDELPTFNGIDWTLIPSLFKATRFFRRSRPEVLILQWWSASTLPAYLVLSALARRHHIPVVIELHEEVDTGEANIPLIGPLIKKGGRLLMSRGSAFVVHSNADFDRMTKSMGIPPERTHVVLLGPFALAGASEQRPVVDRTVTLLFFGTIRPYKGLEFLIEAFDQLPRDTITWRLLVVGETWEGWTKPLQLIASSPFADDIELVNHYVSDDEIPEYFSKADIVVLPYLRSSASGPLHIAMAAGLPLVVSDLDTLQEAAAGYEGAHFSRVGDADHIASSILQAHALVGERFNDPRSWEHTVDSFATIIGTLCQE